MPPRYASRASTNSTRTEGLGRGFSRSSANAARACTTPAHCACSPTLSLRAASPVAGTGTRPADPIMGATSLSGGQHVGSRTTGPLLAAYAVPAQAHERQAASCRHLAEPSMALPYPPAPERLLQRRSEALRERATASTVVRWRTGTSGARRVCPTRRISRAPHSSTSGCRGRPSRTSSDSDPRSGW